MSRDRTRTNFHNLLAEKDGQAWDEFYSVYFSMMIWWAVDYGCTHEEAQEVAQRKTVQLYLKDKFSSFESNGPFSFRRWLKRVTLNEVGSYLRRERRLVSETGLEPSSFETALSNSRETNEDPFEWTKSDKHYYRLCLVNRSLRASLSARSALEGNVFIRRVILAEKPESICRDLGLSRATLDVYISRFRKHLSRELNTNLSDEKNYLGPLSTALNERELHQLLVEAWTSKRSDWDTILESNSSVWHPDEENFNCLVSLLEKWPLPVDFERGLLVLNTNTSYWYFLSEDTTIGREETCKLQLNSKGVSSTHASLYGDKGGYFIRDEQSTNHVYVNGVRISEDKMLCTGDYIQISTWCMIFVDLTKEMFSASGR